MTATTSFVVEVDDVDDVGRGMDRYGRGWPEVGIHDEGVAAS